MWNEGYPNKRLYYIVYCDKCQIEEYVDTLYMAKKYADRHKEEEGHVALYKRKIGILPRGKL